MLTPMGDNKFSGTPHERSLKDQDTLWNFKKSIKNDLRTGSKGGGGRGEALNLARKPKKHPKCWNSKASLETPKTLPNEQRSSAEKHFSANLFAHDSKGSKRA